MEKFGCIVTEVKPLTDTVTFIELCRQDGKAFDFQPGQHVVLHFPETEAAQRYFSVATVPSGGEAFGICVKRTEQLRPTHAMQAGEGVEVSGPFGSLLLREPSAPASLFIAQGTGVTPFLAMMDAMRELLESGHRLRVVLGFRKLSDAWCLDEFDEMLLHYHGFDVDLVLTQPDPAHPTVRGNRIGAILDELIWDLTPAETHVYLAGSGPMVIATRDGLVSLGFDRGNIITESHYA